MDKSASVLNGTSLKLTGKFLIEDKPENIGSLTCFKQWASCVMCFRISDIENLEYISKTSVIIIFCKKRTYVYRPFCDYEKSGIEVFEYLCNLL